MRMRCLLILVLVPVTDAIRFHQSVDQVRRFLVDSFDQCHVIPIVPELGRPGPMNLSVLQER